MKKLHNSFRGTLETLIKTMLELLPKSIKAPSWQKMLKVYFRNAALLAYYYESGVNVVELFGKDEPIQKN